MKLKVKYEMEEKTSIVIKSETRDRLFRLKFRRTYDQFLNELCDLYENLQKNQQEKNQ